MKHYLPAWFFGVAYLITIPAYSLFYWLAPASLTGQELSYLESLYFSAVTVTTLGYGDIYLETELGRLISASEAVLGIVFIGLFLNSLSREWAAQTEQFEKEIAEQKYQVEQVSRLTGRFDVLAPDYWKFMYMVDRLTLPIKGRVGSVSESQLLERVTSDMPFKDMKHMFLPTLLISDGIHKPAIESFVEVDRKISSELRDILKNVDLRKAPYIRDMIMMYLQADTNNDFSEALLEGAERFRTNRDDVLVKLVIEMVEITEGVPTYIKGNLINPYVWLYRVVRIKAVVLQSLRTGIAKLVPDKIYVPYSFEWNSGED